MGRTWSAFTRPNHSMNHSEFHAEIDQATPKTWAEALDQFADANLYQTWAYGETRWGRSALSHLILRRGAEIVAMAQLRIAPQWPFKCGVAFLRWGPVVQRKGHELDPIVIHAMAKALHAEYITRRRLFLRILPAAFSDTPRDQLFTGAFDGFAAQPFAKGETYRTLLLDLTPPLEVLRKNLDQKWRNQLNRAEKNNLQIKVGTGVDHFQAFAQIYSEMLSRKKFSPSSDLNEYVRMQERLADRHQLHVFVCEENGVPVSGAIATAEGDTGIYLFGATSDAGMKAKGAYILQWSIVRWLKESGINYYNLGGINPETNPGVYHFKNGLGGQDVLYSRPLTKCDSSLSRCFVSAGLTAQRTIRWLKQKRG